MREPVLCAWRVFFVIRPNPILHFAPFLSTHFSPCLNIIFKIGSFLSVVALVSVTLFTGKKIDFCTDSLLLPPADFDNGTSRTSRTMRGRNNIVCVFSPSQEHGLCPPWGVQSPFLLNIAGCNRECSAERPAEGSKVGVLVFRVCLGCLECLGC